MWKAGHEMKIYEQWQDKKKKETELLGDGTNIQNKQAHVLR